MSGRPCGGAEGGGTLTLREQVVRGGLYLVVREGAGMALRLGGVLMLTRLIGPAAYGLYSVALASALLLGTIAQMSVEVRLLRSEKEPVRSDFDAATTFLVVSSAVVTALGLVLTWTVGTLVVDERALGPLTVMLLLLPLNVLWAPGQAMLERHLQFKRLAALEIGGDLVLYAVSLPLALTGLGVWAAVAGFAAWQIYRLAGSLLLARYRPRWDWSRTMALTQIREGARISAYTWIYRASDSLTLVLVQALLGAATSGNVALASRLVETLGVVSRVTYRLAIVALARIQTDTDRLRRALEEGMSLQVLAAGIILGAFGLVSDQAIRIAFGSEWSGTAALYPYFAAAALLGAAGTVISALLIVQRKEPAVAVAATCNLLFTMAGTAALAVPWGIQSAGAGRLLGVIPGALVLDRALRRVMGFSYRRALPWLVGTLGVLIAAPLSPLYKAFAVLALFVIVICPGPRAETHGLVLSLRPSKERAST